MERYRKNLAINNLIKLAHEFADKYNLSEKPDIEEDMEEIISIAREVRANTLNFDLPGDFILKDFDSLCKDNGINYAVIGAMAVNVWGVPRETEDIDVLVDKLPPIERLRDSIYMERFGFYRSSSKTGGLLILDHRRNGQVELLLSNSSIRKYALDTSENISLLGVVVPVVSAASLIALKAVSLANNPSRKGKDYPDITSVWVNSNPDLSEVKQFLSNKELEIVNKICVE